jgi:hypothetical protein
MADAIEFDQGGMLAQLPSSFNEPFGLRGRDDVVD